MCICRNLMQQQQFSSSVTKKGRNSDNITGYDKKPMTASQYMLLHNSNSRQSSASGYNTNSNGNTDTHLSSNAAGVRNTTRQWARCRAVVVHVHRPVFILLTSTTLKLPETREMSGQRHRNWKGKERQKERLRMTEEDT